MKDLRPSLPESSMPTLIFHFSARNLAHRLGIITSTACRCWSEVLGMKSRHLRWMPHTLTAAQKVIRAELAQRTLQALAEHQHTDVPF
jgi:hypothetical protein